MFVYGVFSVFKIQFDLPWSDTVFTGFPAVLAGIAAAAIGVWMFVFSWNRPV